MGIIPEYILLNNTSTTTTTKITALVGNQTLLDWKVDTKKPMGPARIPLLLFIISVFQRKFIFDLPPLLTFKEE